MPQVRLFVALAFALLLITAVAGPARAASIAFVQYNTATPQTAQATVKVIYTAAQTLGNLNVVFVGWDDATATVSSVTDTAGNTYSLAANPVVQSGNASQVVYYAKNIFGAAAGANTVTVTFSVAANYPDVRIAEYSGLDTVSPLDVSAGAQATNTSTSNSGSVTTTSANDLLVGGNYVASETTQAGTNYTSRGINQDSDILEDRIVTATGSYNATATLDKNQWWIMQMVAFRAAGSGTTPPSITSLTPSSGPAGASVTIAGANFGASQGSSTVTFNGAAGTPTAWSATSITVPVPVSATSGSVVVTVGGVASNSVAFTVLPTPTITSLTPASAAIGTSVTIAGTNFGGSQGGSTVTFNNIPATPTSWSATSIAVPVPNGATSGNVIVTVGGVASNGVSFTVTSTSPSITSLSPTSGPTGASVTITGVNFGASQGSSTVTFNTTAGTPTAWSATSITVPVPASATTGSVVVTVASVASNGVTFTVLPTPTLTSLSPATGPVGAIVTIVGTNFGASQGSSTVKFNGTAATSTSWSTTSIGVPVPAGATSGSVVVTVGGVASNGLTFTVLPTPTITSLTPTSGPVGGSVTIAGTNFGSSQSGSTVTFGSVQATPSAWSATSITVPVPTGASTGSVIVTVGGVASNGVTFTVLPTPTLTSVTPTSGPAGTSVTIVGTNFGASQGTSTVQFNGTSATSTSWNATTIVVPVPTGATTGNVVVTVSGVASNAIAFTVIPTPTITSLSPTVGPVGSSVTITGTNFGTSPSGSTVMFGGVQGTATSWSATSIVVTVPTGATTGSVIVTVGGVASNGVTFTVGTVAAIAFVQNNSGTPQSSSQATVKVVYTAAQTLGNMNVVVVGWNDSTATVSSVVDTSGNAYALATGPLVQSGLATESIYYAKNIAAAAAGANTVTVTFSVGAYYPDVRIAEYSGLDPVNPVDVAVGAQGTTQSTSNSGSVTTTSANDLLVGANLVQSTSKAAGTGYTNRGITQDGDILEDRIVTATGSYSATATLDKVQGWVMQMVAFRAAGSGSGTPSISSLTPNSGAVGASVTIAGTNFGTTQGSSTVKFNGITATPTTWSGTSIAVPVPNGATTGSVVVTVGGVGSNGVTFTVTSTGPSITSLTPTSGAVGSTVTIAGANFGSSQGTSTVKFNGTSATATSWSASSIAALVPSGATSGSVVVMVGGAASNGVAFTITSSAAPAISGLSPAMAPVGATVVVAGANFGASQGTSTVTFNGTPASTIAWSASSISALVPTGATSGNVIVTVSSVASNSVAFTVGTSPQASITGQWITLPNLMPINPVHVGLMNTGNLLVVSGSGNVANNTNYQAAVFYTATGTVTTQPVTYDMFCSAMVILYDGRPLINGGTLQYDPFEGQPYSDVFTPSTGLFTALPNMADGRWYPTVTTLGDGRVMTFSGLSKTGGTNTSVEFYTDGVGWSKAYTASWTPPLYPRLHVLPNGNVFYSGSTTPSWTFTPSTETWTRGPSFNYAGTRTYGSSVLFPLTPANGYKPEVIIFGGGSPATTTTEIIDLSVATPSWSYGPPMTQPRIEMNATMLPNGKIIALGGSLNDEDTTTASLNADLYNTSTNTMSSAGANSYARLYHSVSLLLPDGTVWFAGGNPARGTYEPHMEIYSPAYLYNSDGSLATRPSITSVPSGAINYGAAFQVQMPDADAATISSVVLMRAGAVTHAFDMEQRLVGLSYTYTPGSGVLNVTAPPNGNIAPPGYYLLFVLNSSGVPSIAQFVQILPN
jgi:hypothetical protein